MGRSTSRVRQRTKKRSNTVSSRDSRWFDRRLQLLTPTPKDRHDWDKHRKITWTTWSKLSKEDRPEGSKLAPVAAIVLDWGGHLGPVFDFRGRRIDITNKSLDDYEKIAGPGFKECREYIKNIYSL